MKPRTILYYFKQAGRSLFRHGWMGAASVLTTAVALLLFGVFVLLMLNISLITGHVESTLEMVVWLQEDADQETAENVQVFLENLSQVTQVRYVSKEEGLEQLGKEFGGEYDLLWSLGGENPLPDFFVVKVLEAEHVRSVASRVANLPPVERVDYGQDYLDKVISLLYWLRMIGLGMVGLLGTAAVFLIGNTVRLTVYARANEISIMKYIGATNWFVRWPFLLEGMFLGAIGAAIAGAFVYFGYNFLIEQIAPTISFIPLVQDPQLLLQIAVALVGIGLVLGGVASFLSLGRYLRF